MLKQLLVYGLVLFLLLSLIIYFYQRQLIYFPLKYKPVKVVHQAIDFETVQLATDDGVLLNSWYKKAKKNWPTIVYLHGNAGHIGYRVPFVRPYIQQGFGVFLLEYRGYGGNLGQPTESGLYQDGRAAILYLKESGIPISDLILYGESLGTGVATQLATENDVCALVLQSPFLSLASLARHHYPWVFVKPWDKYDTGSKIRKINAPLLILHGEKDQIVPFSQGLSLFEKAQNPKKIIPLSSAGHNDITLQPDFFIQVLQFMKASCSAMPLENS